MIAGATRILLGPQRPHSRLPDALASAALPDGPVAVISAGWQEAEGDIDDVQQLVARPVRDLLLYQRAEQIFAAHQELQEAYRVRQERLKDRQRLYRLRLRYLMDAARQVMRADADPALLATEKRHAIAQLRALDRHHVHCVAAIHEEFAARFSSDKFAPLAEHVAAIRKVLDECQAVVITGGNVIILLNRLLLFGLGSLLQDRHIIAWSAGAMVLGEQILLFHDRMPEGRRDAELLGTGLSLLPEYVVLPDAKHRLRSGDRLRMTLLGYRLAPKTCVMLNYDSLLKFSDDRITAAEATRYITRKGGSGAVTAA
jgi:hypothetical protein